MCGDARRSKGEGESKSEIGGGGAKWQGAFSDETLWVPFSLQVSPMGKAIPTIGCVWFASIDRKEMEEENRDAAPSWSSPETATTTCGFSLSSQSRRRKKGEEADGLFLILIATIYEQEKRRCVFGC